MSLAQKIWYEIDAEINKGFYQTEIEHRVHNRPEFVVESTTQDEINFMMKGEKIHYIKNCLTKNTIIRLSKCLWI